MVTKRTLLGMISDLDNELDGICLRLEELEGKISKTTRMKQPKIKPLKPSKKA